MRNKRGPKPGPRVYKMCPHDGQLFGPMTLSAAGSRTYCSRHCACAHLRPAGWTDPKQYGSNVAAVAALRHANPKMLLREIGEQVGLTRERVRQILKREGLPTRGAAQR